MADAGPCRCGRGTLYDVLQVSPWCEPEVIQAAYRALARTRHPDLNRDPDAEDQMRRLNVAYQTLSDPVQRARYDEELALESARAVMQRASASTTISASGRFDIDDLDLEPATSRPEGGYRPSASRPGATQAHDRVHTTTSSGPVASSAAPAHAYQAMLFDHRGDGMLSRSALYLVVVLVTVILALFAYIIIDIIALDGPITPRGARTQGARTQGTGAWNTSSPHSWQLDGVDADARPGLSSPGERWNR